MSEYADIATWEPIRSEGLQLAGQNQMKSLKEPQGAGPTSLFTDGQKQIQKG